MMGVTDILFHKVEVPLWTILVYGAITLTLYLRNKRYMKKKKVKVDDDDQQEDDSEYEGEIKQYGLLDSPYKMVLCVNMSLKMDKGKIAAQCGHATLAAYRISNNKCPMHVRAWETTGQAKIAIKCSEEEMYTVAKEAASAGLVHYIVTDQGRTQIAAGSQTVCVIGPAPVHEIDKITKNYKLL